MQSKAKHKQVKNVKSQKVLKKNKQIKIYVYIVKHGFNVKP